MFTIFISGATGAIGSALAKYYAKPDIHLIIHGRNQACLQELAKQCQMAGAEVSILILDLRNISELRSWILRNLAESPPDLVIANAGVSINNIDHFGENWEEVENLLEINIKSTFALVNAIIPLMIKRGNGQIVLISSLAGYYGLPVNPSYSASKAAIKVYGEALRGYLAPSIKVNVVMPGGIRSKMCNATDAPHGLALEPDQAARNIAHGIAKNQARISFPFPLNLGAWFLNIVPSSIAQLCLNHLGYNIKKII